MSDTFIEVLRVRGNGQITLPAALRRAAEISEGDALAVHRQPDGSIVLKPVVVLDRLEADLLLRLQLREEQAIVGSDLKSRAKDLKKVQEMDGATGSQLDRIVTLLGEGQISQREFIGRAIALGLPTSSIDTLLSAHAASEEPSPFAVDDGQFPDGNSESGTVRISQAVRSLLYLPLYIADHAGFFEEEGVEVEISTAGGGAESWSAVLAGSADYSVQDPVFAVASMEKGVHEAVVVASVCNGQAIIAAARNPEIQPTDDPQEFMTRTLRKRTVATQPEPDSQWAVLQYLGFLYGVQMGREYQNVQVPIGAELDAVLKGEADIGMGFPPQIELAMDRGLHEVFDFSRFFAPYALSTLCTMRSTIAARPRVHQAVINAFEKACQYAYDFPEEAVKIACHEFPEESPDAVASATRRCLRRLLVPQHSYVDGEAWRKSQIMNRFVGTIDSYHELTECVNNEAALHAYRVLGALKTTWDRPRPIRVQAATQSARTTSGRSASPKR